jgi:hypothetical protein
MRKVMVAILMVILIAVSAATGYSLGTASQNTTNPSSCSPLPASRGASASIVGFHVTVSYGGSWRLTIATFASKVVEANTFFDACVYYGSGTMSFYVAAANYLGWNTLVALAHKFGSNGTLTVTANLGPVTGSNSTTQSYGSAITTISFNFT